MGVCNSCANNMTNFLSPETPPPPKADYFASFKEQIKNSALSMSEVIELERILNIKRDKLHAIAANRRRILGGLSDSAVLSLDLSANAGVFGTEEAGPIKG